MTPGTAYLDDVSCGPRCGLALLGAVVVRRHARRRWNGSANDRLGYDGAFDFSTPPEKGDLTRSAAYHTISTSVTDPAKYYATDYAHDSYGNRTVVTDTNGFAARTAYDPIYHVYPLTLTNALGQAVIYSYSYTLGKVISQTDANGASTQYSYDAFGRIKKVARPGDTLSYPTEEYSYYDGGDNTRTDQWPFLVGSWQRGTPGLGWSSGGLATWGRTFYDGLGQVVQRQQSAEGGDLVQYTGYDGQGRVVTESVPYLATAYVYSTNGQGQVVTPYKTPDASKPLTLSRYDALGRTTVITAPDGTVTKSGYLGWSTAVLDANSHQRVSSADAFGRLTTVKEYDGSFTGGINWSAGVYATTSYAYDTLGNLTRVTDTLGNATSLTYDALGRKTAMTDPDMGNWRYGYDPAGNLVGQTDAKGQNTAYTYDELGRLRYKAAADSGNTTFVDNFDVKNTAAWTWSTHQVVPFNDAGSNVVKNQGTGSSFDANFYRPTYALRTGQSVQLRFKVDSTDSVAHFVVEADDPVYRRGAIADGGKLKVQYRIHNARLYPADLLTSLLTNTWYVLQIGLDDTGRFTLQA